MTGGLTQLLAAPSVPPAQAHAARVVAHALDDLARMGISRGSVCVSESIRPLATAVAGNPHVRHEAPDCKRIVVGVDPSGSSKAGSAETGIVVAGRGRDDHGYILADASLTGTPEQWGRVAVDAYHYHQADRIVVERNFGGEMCRHVIGSIDRTVRVVLVTASRGKAIRAEPVVSLYEQNRIHHVGQFPTLEDQMTGWAPMGNDPSPDRLDALVWACSELMVTGHQVYPSLTFNEFFGAGLDRSGRRYADWTKV
jgi:hypothetical protein